MYDQVFDFSAVFAAYDQLLLGAALTLRLTAEAIVLGMVVAIVGMSHSLLKFAERSPLFKSYAAWAI